MPDEEPQRPDEESENLEDAGMAAVAGEEPPGSGEETELGGVETAEEQGDAGKTAEEEAREGGTETFSVRAVNRAVLGELTLHYPQRDVRLVLDGETAIRVLPQAA